MARLPKGRRPLIQRTRAAALRYEPKEPFLDAAPRLVAKGQGLLAERILKLARQYGVPIEKNPNLMAALAPLEVDKLIPTELFQAVAVMLAALYQANRRESLR